LALNLVMLGAPGAGKGTQAERLAAKRGIPKISTGDMLRTAVRAGSGIGLRAKAIMERGELVSDAVMIDIVRERLDQADAGAGFVLDGFPRTVAQASALDGLLVGREPLIVVVIDVPEDELIRRLTTRVICESCGSNAEDVSLSELDVQRCVKCGGRLKQRADDNEAVVRERLKVYRVKTKPLVDFYRTRLTFRTINGAQLPDAVAADLLVAVDSARGAAAGGALR
jgi:adenylate kinase